MVNWEESLDGTTHYFKDQWKADWWLKDIGGGECLYCRIGVQKVWRPYPTSLHDLAERHHCTFLARGNQPEVVAPKKQIGWW